MNWAVGILVMVEAVLVVGSTCLGFVMSNSMTFAAGFVILTTVCVLACLIQFLGDKAESP
ncbi:MAG: hypothetical protein H8D32_02565 [Dehalococcoidia bacterium]|nr:hypothetical protein [Dehalococcoidia bacterium]